MPQNDNYGGLLRSRPLMPDLPNQRQNARLSILRLNPPSSQIVEVFRRKPKLGRKHIIF